MAMAGSLCASIHAVDGFTNRSLRALAAGLLGSPYTTTADDLRPSPAPPQGLIRRLDHRHLYVFTNDGLKVALFYTKLYKRLLRPLMVADQPPAPRHLRQALPTINHSLEEYVARARIAA